MRRTNLLFRLLLIAMLATLALASASCGGDEGDDEQRIEVADGEVLLEPASSHGREPFADEPYADADADAAATDAQDTFIDYGADADGGDADEDGATLKTAAGGEPGLYGGSGSQSLCDRKLLERFLDANPSKARAWTAAFNADDDFEWIDAEGDVHGRLSRSDIPEFLDSLTPLLLTRDTRVTNHGYRDGEPVPLQSVLQAGTAVLVDPYGIPRVRCACGNPLLEPAPVKGKVTYVGRPWKSFRPASITVVMPVEAIIEIFIVVDPDDTDATVKVPRGEDAPTDVSDPDPASPADDATSTPDTDAPDDAATSGGDESEWQLEGTWSGSDDSTYRISQSGSSITWAATSNDGSTWAHDFSGRIQGDRIVGQWTDRPGYSVESGGRLTVRIVDDCTLAFVSASAGFGTQTWARDSCGA